MPLSLKNSECQKKIKKRGQKKKKLWTTKGKQVQMTVKNGNEYGKPSLRGRGDLELQTQLMDEVVQLISYE